MKLTMAQYQWQLPERNESFIDNLTQLEQAGLDFSPAFLRILAHRGLNTRQNVEMATDQTPQIYHDPFLLYEMDKVILRIQEAITQNERILIYGDYDADGITSTLILYETLEMLGADVQYYLPHREHDGYGPNIDRYREFIEVGIQLILTCDNGIAGFEAIEFAQGQGIDVIVTDHHEIQGKLPQAYAIIHPDHPLGEYPFKSLSGAGVALKVATALMDEVPIEAIELAMIGTMADMVALTDENRTIVLSGLNLLKSTQRIGLKLLLDTQGIDSESINEDTIGFTIGPRLNAIGRLGDPTPGLELLKTFDEDVAQELVGFIENENQRRKDMVDHIYQEVLASFDHQQDVPDIIIAGHETWTAGILGIVASRLLNEFHRPVILCQYIPEQHVYKGSARSIEGINIFKLLRDHHHLLKYFGGHEQAAGLTISQENWQEFIQSMQTGLLEYRTILDQPQTLPVDVTLSLSEITLEFIQELKLLGPFGTGNPKVSVHIEDITLQQLKYLGKNKTHLKLQMSQDGTTLPGLLFNKAHLFDELQEEMTLSCIGYLDINRWNNQVSVQCLLEDMGIKGRQWIDVRGSEIPAKLFELSHTYYVFENDRVMRHIQQQLSHDHIVTTYDSLDVQDTYDQLVIMQPPKHLSQLTHLIKEHSWKKIYLGSYVHESKYLHGLPQRTELQVFYTWLMQQPAFEIRPNLVQIAKHLNIPVLKIKTMIKMFLEAKFVTIKNGWIQANSVQIKEKIDLMQLPTALAYQEAMEVEALLNYKSIEEVKAYFEKEEDG